MVQVRHIQGLPTNLESLDSPGLGLRFGLTSSSSFSSSSLSYCPGSHQNAKSVLPISAAGQTGVAQEACVDYKQISRSRGLLSLSRLLFGIPLSRWLIVRRRGALFNPRRGNKYNAREGKL